MAGPRPSVAKSSCGTWLPMSLLCRTTTWRRSFSRPFAEPDWIPGTVARGSICSVTRSRRGCSPPGPRSRPSAMSWGTSIWTRHSSTPRWIWLTSRPSPSPSRSYSDDHPNIHLAPEGRAGAVPPIQAGGGLSVSRGGPRPRRSGPIPGPLSRGQGPGHHAGSGARLCRRGRWAIGQDPGKSTRLDPRTLSLPRHRGPQDRDPAEELPEDPSVPLRAAHPDARGREALLDGLRQLSRRTLLSPSRSSARDCPDPPIRSRPPVGRSPAAYHRGCRSLGWLASCARDEVRQVTA